jgi:hypothetical protein
MSKQNMNKKKKGPKPAVVVKEQTIGNKILSGIGGKLGELVGLKSVGADAGSWLSRVTGLGAYTLHQNSFTRSSASVPTFEYTADGGVIITHREYITDISGSTTYTNTTYDICPSNPGPFPWLAVQALGYTEYEFLGLLFAYVPLSGDAIASTNNTLGSVTMSTEYDMARSSFTSKKEMAEYMFTTTENPSVSQLHPVECNPKRDVLNSRYTRDIWRTATLSDATFSKPADLEENFCCIGRLQVATTGQQAVTTVGELWATYRVKFTKPRISPNGYPHGMLQACPFGATMSNGQTLFSPITLANNSTLFSSGISVSGGTISFNTTPPNTIACIRICIRGIGGGSPVVTSLGSAVLTGCSAVQAFFAGSNPQTGIQFGVGTANFCEIRYVVIDAFNATVVYPNPALGGGTTFEVDLNVTTQPRKTGATLAPITAVGFEVQDLRMRLAKLEFDEKEYHLP